MRLGGEVISGLKMHDIARRGLVRTFQHSTLFAEMSVLENVLVGTHIVHPPNIFKALLGQEKKTRAQAEERSTAALEFFGLDQVALERAGELAHGHQRALGMAIAYAAKPDVMLLDEPFTGMNPEETGKMMALMEKLRENGVTIMIVEHDMKAIMGLCDSITCMSFGKLLAEGGPKTSAMIPPSSRPISDRPMMLLEMRGATVRYGKITAIRDVSISVPGGGIVTIIGANGAGKTTTLRAMSGLAKLAEGEIHFDGERIDRLPADRIVARGIAHVPEGRRIFPDLTVVENLNTGAFLQAGRRRGGFRS